LPGAQACDFLFIGGREAGGPFGPNDRREVANRLIRFKTAMMGCRQELACIWDWRQVDLGLATLRPLIGNAGLGATK
jgi:hypothetical protein